MSMPVGTAKIRNQKKTSDGKRPACESVRPRSFCTKLDAVPTRSTNPMAKKQSITGTSLSMDVFLVIVTDVFMVLFDCSENSAKLRIFHIYVYK